MTTATAPREGSWAAALGGVMGAAWFIRGVVFPIVAILVVALSGFRGLQSLEPAEAPSRGNAL
jgi:hypothetical protein